MNVMISVNDKYVDKVESMLLSLRNNCNQEITVYLVNHSLSDKSLEHLSLFLNKNCDIKLISIPINHTVFDELPIVSPNLFSIEIFYRIVAPYILPESVKRILWLDADIIIKENIDDFYNMDFQNRSLIACMDNSECLPEKAMEIKKRLNISNDHVYFNSGVLIMNLTRMRQRHTLDEICTICRSLKDKLFWPDQDILNVLYEKDVLYTDLYRYNINPVCFWDTFLHEYEQIKIIHYYGPNKPWQFFKGLDPKFDYWKIQKQRGRFLRYFCTIFLKPLWLLKLLKRCYHLKK